MRTPTSLVLALFLLGSCGDDDTAPPGGDGANDSAVNDGATADMGGGPDTMNPHPDAGGTEDGGGLCADEGESCSNGSAVCCGMLDCCAGVPVPPGAEFCSDMCPRSDVNVKEGFASIDHEDVLRRLRELSVTTWSYKDEPGVVHMGPMAQDFAAAFGLGATDTRIYTIDENGVNMAAIQALAKKLDALEAENAALRKRVDQLEHGGRR